MGSITIIRDGKENGGDAWVDKIGKKIFWWPNEWQGQQGGWWGCQGCCN